MKNQLSEIVPSANVPERAAPAPSPSGAKHSPSVSSEIQESKARKLLSEVPEHIRVIHANARALRLRVSMATADFIKAAAAYGAQASMPAFAQSQTGIAFAVEKALLETLEHSEEFKTASEIIDPLLATIAAEEEADLQQRLELARAEGELRRKLEEAQERAREAAEKDSGVVAAKSRLEALKGSFKKLF